VAAIQANKQTSGTSTGTSTGTSPIQTGIQKLATAVKIPQGTMPTGNQPFAGLSALEIVAKRFGIPMQMNTHGQTAVFYAGLQNGIPQVAKYSNTGKFIGTYAQENLLGQTSPIGSIAGGHYQPPGTFKITGGSVS
jgi:hypothetical protein